MIDWLIVGGGVQGTTLGVWLRKVGGVPSSSLRIIDPEAELLGRWGEMTQNVGMEFLRSPVVHHLDVQSHALESWMKGQLGEWAEGAFTAPYHRPSYEWFQRFHRTVIEETELSTSHTRGWVTGLEQLGREGWRVRWTETTSSASGRGSSNDSSESVEAGTSERTVECEARHVVLAIGVTDRPAWPDWANRLRDTDDRGRILEHLFSRGFSPETWGLAAGARVAVVGGGISAAQVALKLAKFGAESILIRRHPIREADFDSDPGWLGPRRMNGFSKVRCYRRRRAEIQRARNRGSLPREVASDLKRAVRHGRIQELEGVVTEAVAANSGVRLQVSAAGRTRRLAVDRVLLATGFEGRRPGGAWLDETIAACDLPVAPCGFPIVDASLRWDAPAEGSKATSGLYVAGGLAELELGPTARNIAGARESARRLTEAARWCSTEPCLVAAVNS